MKLFFKLSCAIIALCVIPILLFSTYLNLTVTSPMLDNPIKEEFSLQTLKNGLNFTTENADITDVLKNLNLKDVWAGLGNLRIALIVTVAALALAILLALVIAVAALFSKKKMTIAVLAGVGLLLMLTTVIAFSLFAGPFLDGSFSVLSLLGASAETLKGIGDLIGSITGALLQVTVLKLGSIVSLMFFLFVALLILCAVFYILEIFLEGGRPERKKKVLSPVQRAQLKEKEQKKQQNQKK